MGEGLGNGGNSGSDMLGWRCRAEAWHGPTTVRLTCLVPVTRTLACWQVAPGAFTSPYGDSPGAAPVSCQCWRRRLEAPPSARASHRTPSACLGVQHGGAKTSREQKKVKWAHLPVLFWGVALHSEMEASRVAAIPSG